MCFPIRPLFSNKAPKMESTWQPSQPIDVTTTIIVNRGISTSVIEARLTDNNAISSAPPNAANVPVNDIPPLVPAGTASRLMMLLVLESRLPISDAKVSEAATEIHAQAAM